MVDQVNPDLISRDNPLGLEPMTPEEEAEWNRKFNVLDLTQAGSHIERIDVIGQNGNTGEHYSTGRKHDQDKIRADLVLGGFPRALQEVARAGTYGAVKYAPGNWIKVENGIERYSDAMIRHYLDERRGELCDQESNALHAAHLAWNALARLELMLIEMEAANG